MINCDPTSLMAAARCMSCLTPDQRSLVQTYLLAVIAGVATDKAGVSRLMQQASCFSCLTPEQHLMIQTYLECQIQAKS